MKPANEATYHRTAGDALLITQPEGAGIEESERDEERWGLEIAQALDKHYPGHPWMVSFQGSALIIRHLEIAHRVMLATGRNGFGTVLPPHRQGTLKEVIASAIHGAGEMLECFKMPRGRWDEAHPPQVPDWPHGKSQGFS